MQGMRIATLVLMLVGNLAAQRVVSTSLPATPEQQAQRLVRQLELPARCSEAWRGLLELGPAAALPLAAATADPRPDVAMRAFHVLGLLRDDGEAALPRLREHLAGKDPQLAAAAAWAIDRIEFRGRLLADYQTGAVEHLDATGAVVRTITCAGPWHAEPVGNGVVLVSEYTGNCVREFDRLGKEVWKFADVSSPYYVQRLPDGRTVISDAGHNRVIEVDRAGKVVWERKELKRPVAAVRTPDGHTLIVEQQGNVLELDEQDNVLWQAELGAARAMRAQRLNNGNTLIAMHVGNQVVELGPDAKEAAKPIEVQQAQAALRRRDGHTLISATTHWLELDAAGKEIWRRKGQYAVGIFW